MYIDSALKTGSKMENKEGAKKQFNNPEKKISYKDFKLLKG